MQRSLKEAAGELEARLAANTERRFPVMGLRGAAGALMIREMRLRLTRPIVAVTSTAPEAEALAGEVAFFLDEPADADAATRRVHLLRSWEVKPMAQLSPPTDAQASQLAALFAMLRHESPLIVTSAEALMTRTIPRASFNESIVTVAIGDRLDLDALVEALSACGYQRVPQTEEAGDFSVRGGIVDAFSPLYRDPIRIELEDDVITSIRHFDADTQRSGAELVEATIIRTRYVPPSALKDPKMREQVVLRAAEIGMVRKEAAELAETLENGLLFPGAELLMPYAYGRALDSVFDYMPPNALLWLVDSGRVLAEANRFADIVSNETEVAARKPAFHPAPDALFLGVDTFEKALGNFTAVEVGSLVTMAAPREGWAVPVEVKSQNALRLGANQLSGVRTPPSFEPLATELREVQRGQGRSLMIVEGPNQVARLRRHLEAYDLEVNVECKSLSALMEWPDFRPAIMEGEISAGVVLQEDGLYIYSEEEIFGEPRARRRRRPTAKGALLNLEELKPDDFVVHIDHGIAKYRGLRHMKVADVQGDFLNLEYAGNDTMYVPVERINLVQRYIGGDNAEPKLDKLGSGSWEKVKRRTRQAVLAMAAELLDIYAAREVMEGHAYPAPGNDYEEFASRFEFEETPDQQAAIDDVIRDLTRVKPMDRLICGDAGFGKTEVALRAAFIAVMDGRQVAVLVPTTILAEQHWNTFRERFKDLPVRVEMVSRFRSHKENKAVIEDAAAGKVDVIIGTHRLLSSDVQFPRLGLLVIDEEHRFGVVDKERIKKLKKLVPVLTMTATPIPRTLHMAMLGIRDLSVIQTPPPDRQAIRTFVAHFDDATIRDSILRELNRGGQVFFVHNRVENIDYMASHLRSLVPEAKIAIAHGQMKERQLEDVMRDFIEKRDQRAGLQRDHRIGPRHSQRQHDDHQSRRPFRPCAAIPVARTRRPLASEGVRVPADSRRAHHHARRQAANRRAARAGRVRERRRLQAGDGRPRASRRRQSARPRAARRDRGGRLRALYRDDGRGDRRAARTAESTRLRARAANRGARVHPRGLRRRRKRAAGAVSAARARAERRGPRRDSRRDARSFRPGADADRKSDRRDERSAPDEAVDDPERDSQGIAARGPVSSRRSGGYHAARQARGSESAHDAADAVVPGDRANRARGLRAIVRATRRHLAGSGGL